MMKTEKNKLTLPLKALAVRTSIAALTVLSALTAISGCAPLLIGGAMVGGGLVATDRRTTGAQIEDEAIEIKAGARIRELATLGRVNVVSYNRLVLVVGEVPGATEKAAVGQAVARIENVRNVVNELVLAPNSNVGSRSNDTLLTTKVKATLVDAQDVQANAIKVVAERGVIYLMGRVTEREATRAADLARTIAGVQKVVRVFDVLSEAELGSLGRGGAGAPAAPVTTAASAPATK
jgi:osmotically-inducible protein OsmY